MINVLPTQTLATFKRNFYESKLPGRMALLPRIRVGQVLMNYLFEVWEDGYAHIIEHGADCYEDDNKIEMVWRVLEMVWPTI